MKSVNVLGLGYIGLPTAALLACSGFRVYGTDISPIAVNTVNAGAIHIVEPDLEDYVRKAVAGGMLSAHLTPQAADIYMICVPTPFAEGSETIPAPDLSYVRQATAAIAELIKAGDIIILESTSPIGTTEEVGQILRGAGVDLEKVFIAYCPERVLPGQIMRELISNNRIIGGVNARSAEKVADFYANFVEGSIVTTNARTAEMCKLAENSFRDINIAFANELSVISEENDVDIWELIRLTNLHPRVNILQPGTGVGGHCIAVDPWFLASASPKNSRLIQTARRVNLAKPEWVIDRICEAASTIRRSDPARLKIACLGLAFKPDIDDLRESPAMKVASHLKTRGFEVLSVEPNIEDHESLNLISFVDALVKADLITILVRHSEFVDQSNIRLLRNAKTPVLDFCGALA